MGCTSKTNSASTSSATAVDGDEEALDAANIEIPSAHRSLYAGQATAPFPIRIVEDVAASAWEAVAG
ncbi:hypothetical protein [Algiphilus sp.]|uniref:hypothetical protein n=1 Tax=Algiphilus sp. TaxID=1872431 RepID=UPI003B52D737